MFKLTNVRNVNQSSKILKTASKVGKVADIAGKAAIAIIPFAETETSFNLYTQKDFDLVAQEDPKYLGQFTLQVGASSVLDAASYGFVRSTIKTPGDIINLAYSVVTGGDSIKAIDKFDKLVNDTINARTVREGTDKIIGKVRKSIFR